MAEVKNAFIKSKMNKDLDARLIPQGEYRDAINVQVSKSEGDDVGALENVLGNFSVAEFEPTVPDLTCIGFFVNEFNSTVYLFFTDYTDLYTGGNPTYNPSANNFIYQYNTLSSGDGITKLVEGAFLNFSKNRPIIGVNVVEDLLFFTDNRNQPRKINVSKAFDSSTYYQTEDQISVAKYNPYQPIYLWKTSEQLAAETAVPVVVGNVTDSFDVTVDSISDISVGQGVIGKGGAVVKPYTYVEEINGLVVTLNRTQTLSDGDSIAFVNIETSMYDAANKLLPDGSVNPYYEEDPVTEDPLFPGDPKFLEDKFVRFSYRFKFDDGEYSLIAPFTQPCFIPKQDGYFTEGDEQQAVASTILGFMENKVNKIDLQIPLPTAGNLLFNDFKITELDIIYKESDALALQVVETIQVDSISSSAEDSDVFEYTYNSTKPFKTLPSNEITRVYDKVPVKALGQEIISNRVVYSNFQDKHTPPTALTYQVAANEKYTLDEFYTSKTTLEYPNHNVKENRNYQVGVVLADRYGRQSTVILSNDDSDADNEFGADTVYLPYDDAVAYNPTTFLGNSLKVLFNDFITSNKDEKFGRPGLYNGDATSSAYNPLGWYSYKIVVKQIEQEYYNVYAAGAMRGNPVDSTLETNTSFITIINDNINKIPRDLSEIGPQDKTFRSSVRLFGRVVNIIRSFNNQGNKQYQPEQTGLSFTTSNIEDLFDLFDVAGENQNHPITSPSNIFHAFYKAESNPFIAQFVTSQLNADKFGMLNTAVNNTYPTNENLIILETDPTVSNIDIFFESSTTGLISELNEAIGVDTGGAFAIQNFEYDHQEAFDIGDDITEDFEFVDVLNNVVVPTSTPTIVSVTDNAGSGERKTEFSLVTGTDPATYKLRTNSYFYYGPTAIDLESYTFTFRVTVDDGSGGSTTTDVSISGALTNNDPIINNDNAPDINVDQGDVTIIAAIDAENGSADPTRNTLDLNYSIPSQSGNGVYEIQGLSVVNTDSNAIGRGSFTLRVVDAGGAQVEKTFNVNFGQPPVTAAFDEAAPIQVDDADGYALFFTNDTTGLESNIPSYFDTDTGSWLTGFEGPVSPTTVVTNDVCPSGSTNLANFVNVWQETGLTQGAFFVYINPQTLDSGDTVTGPQPQINVRWSVEYRANSSSTWSSAVDISGQIPSTDGTWYYIQGSSEGWESLSTDAFNTGTSISVPQGPGGGAGRVLAFDLVGEYRIIFGNIQSTYINPSDPGATAPAYNNSASCTNAQNLNILARYFTQDLYSPGTDFAPDFATYGSVYRYEISSSVNNACGDSWSDATTVYAAEPFARYVKQFYTDTDLTIKASFTGTSVKRYRRMYRVDASGADQNPDNPEFTVDGAYRSTISSTGLRSGAVTPCLY